MACSIHVTGEGEGSKATLIAWLKRRAAQQYGQRVVGQHVWVCWCADATFYKGLITHYSPETGKHKVRLLHMHSLCWLQQQCFCSCTDFCACPCIACGCTSGATNAGGELEALAILKLMSKRACKPKSLYKGWHEKKGGRGRPLMGWTDCVRADVTALSLTASWFRQT